MFAVCVTFRVRPDAMDRFLPRMHQQARDSLTLEKGCLRFDVCVDSTAPGSVFLYEVYDDREAFELHSDSSHFKSFASDVDAYVLGKDVVTFDSVAVGGTP